MGLIYDYLMIKDTAEEEVLIRLVVVGEAVMEISEVEEDTGETADVVEISEVVAVVAVTSEVAGEEREVNFLILMAVDLSITLCVFRISRR
jgi:hypothetical protein